MRICACTSVVAVVLCSVVLGIAQSAKSSAPERIVIEASRPILPPAPADFVGGTATNRHGEAIGMNERYLTLNGRPWLPVMGEFHFTRVPAEEWEEEILKMKAAGVQIVAAYVIWIHHEEVEDRYDWSGERDLRRFVELCGKHDMYVYLRIGPWAHGEARNGGFPDWLLKKTDKTRSNDPVYLSYVDKWYAEIAGQVRGLLWKGGGPVIGIQFENEYGLRGPGQGEEHILRLKQAAIALGLDVPIYSVTGWDNAVVPKKEVVAVFGGYPDAPWDSSMDALPPSEVYAFRFGSRVSGNMGVIGGGGSAKEAPSQRFPFMTAEMGGGVQDTYHRRPVIAPDDVAAMTPVMLGSGVNLYGTYMFQGGENPQGKLTTLQESQATGYPTDVPVKSYDFQAPLSQFGEERELLRKVKVTNYFLNDFGEQLAPMVSFAPDKVPKDSSDFSVARVSVRTNGQSGFLFFNNYARGSEMSARPAFQVQVRLAGHELDIPDRPVDLPSGAYGIWPFEMQLGLIHLRYATAQLLCRTRNGNSDTYYFVTTPGVSPQIVLVSGGENSIEARGKVERRSGLMRVTDIAPSFKPSIVASDRAGHTTRIVLLTSEDAENAWRLDANGEHLLITRAQYFSSAEKVVLQSGDPKFSFTVIPPISAPHGKSVSVKEISHFNFATGFTTSLPAANPALKVEQVRDAGAVPAVNLGPALDWRPHGVALAPDDTAFSAAAQWNITIPSSDWVGVRNLFLQIKYDGDVARLMAGGNLLNDNFYNGEAWRVGLARYRDAIAAGSLMLELLPRRADSPIFLESRFRDPSFTSGQRAILKSAELIPMYELKLNFDTGP
jgi:beta-galactosidase